MQCSRRVYYQAPSLQCMRLVIFPNRFKVGKIEE